ncbi:MAG: metallopeptidase TldD-related protein, partial [Bryobacteraceae bacterium]
GEKLFPDFINLHTDPFDPRMPALPWTSSRLPMRPIGWIENGAVKNLAYSRYWAEKTGKSATPSPDPLYLDGGGASLDDLIASVERGLLVTHFWYIRFVNPKTLQHTGLTRDGLFLIENGKIAAPVMNFRFNESPVRLLQNARKLSKPVRVRGLEGGMMVAPAILAGDFHFTSISDAV